MAQVFNALIGTTGYGYQVRLIGELTETGTNVSANTSTVHRKVWAYITGGTASDYTTNVYVNGINIFSGYANITTAATVFLDDYINVAHASDGKGSCSLSGKMTMSYLGYNGNGSGSIQLSTIPRAAKITVANDFNDEENPEISISNPGKWNMEAWLEPNPNGTHYAIRTINSNATSYQWELSEEERKQLRQACRDNSCKIRIGLYSKDKSFNHYVDKQFSIINANPIFTEADFISINHQQLADEKTVINGYSNITVTVKEAVALKEGTISLYKIICGSKMVQGTDVKLNLENVDDSIIRCYAIDSRGNTTERILNIEKYISYSPITLDVLEVNRKLNEMGTEVTLQFSGKLWTGNFGLLDNSIKAQYYYRELDSKGDWIQGTSNIDPETNSTFKKVVDIKGDLETLGFDKSKAFEIKVIVTDQLSNKDRITQLTKFRGLIYFHTDGIGIGGEYDSNITVNGEACIMQFYSKVYDKMIPVEMIPYQEQTKITVRGRDRTLEEYLKEE